MLDKRAGRVYLAGLFVMKTTIIALAAMASPLMAQEAAPAAPAAPAPAPETQAPAVDQAEYAKYQAPLRETISCMTQLMETLKGVNSKESADAAAPKVKEILANMEKLQAQAEGLATAPAEIQQKLQAEFEPQIQGVIGSMGAVFIPLLTNQCYGSQALMDAMMPLLSAPGPESAPAPAPESAPAA